MLTYSGKISEKASLIRANGISTFGIFTVRSNEQTRKSGYCYSNFHRFALHCLHLKTPNINDLIVKTNIYIITIQLTSLRLIMQPYSHFRG